MKQESQRAASVGGGHFKAMHYNAMGRSNGAVGSALTLRPMRWSPAGCALISLQETRRTIIVNRRESLAAVEAGLCRSPSSPCGSQCPPQ